MANNEKESNASDVSQEEEEEEENIHVNHVPIKIQPFWRRKPRTWFVQVESQLSLAKITDDQTKFNHVVSAINCEILDEVADVVDNARVGERYKAIKAALIDRFTDLDQRRNDKLLNELELGDMKPSQLLRKMEDLARNRMSADVLRSLWLRRLPDIIRVGLQSFPMNIPELPTAADRILEFMRLTVATTSTPARTRSRPCSRNRSRTPGALCNTGICWYHQAYGTRAKKCTTPCKFARCPLEAPHLHQNERMTGIIQYVVVRGDLSKTMGWPLGAIIAQACHACTAVIHLFYDDTHTQAYLTDLDNMHKVVLEAADEAGLRTLCSKLKEDDIQHKLWIEQPENVATCLVTKPYPKDKVQSYFKKYKLLKT